MALDFWAQLDCRLSRVRKRVLTPADVLLASLGVLSIGCGFQGAAVGWGWGQSDQNLQGENSLGRTPPTTPETQQILPGQESRDVHCEKAFSGI